MMSIIKKIWRFYVYSNLHISFGAAAIAAAGQHVAQQPIDPYFLITVLGTTMISYSLHRWIGYQRMRDTTADLPERFYFMVRHPAAFYISIGLSVISTLYGLSRIGFEYIIGLSVLGVGTLLYLLPVFTQGRRLRDLPYIKIGIVSAVWSGVFCLPMMIADWETQIIVLYYLHCFVFFVGLTIPFDVRDIVLDDINDVKTLSNTRSISESKIIITLCYATCLILSAVMVYTGLLTLRMMWPLFILIQISWFLSIYRIQERSEIYFMGVLDGLIILYGLIYML